MENRSVAQDQYGRFFLFGGVNFSSQYDGMSDLWLFDPSILSWKLLFGTNLPGQAGSYGTLGVPSSSNAPPYRFGAISWWGNDNRFYMFGGMQDVLVANTLNDVW